ncbi:DUF6503 family protein [Lewinella sp. IMCC34183]|uniref:DUF6503 family protein n=1 Tax=Lewinella sp. IMCC34183 TaxID=2248762 RepID=UPI00130074A9|nr:DUF6503 family protein [Lewinella sp. IMCC34183]
MFLILLCTCGPAEPAEAPAPAGAAAIIDRAVRAHGMERFDSVAIDFAFRDRHYQVLNDNGRFAYRRRFVDSLGGEVTDLLTNQGLTRMREGETPALTAQDSAAYASSVNSVRYFFMLPYGLYDPAVNTEVLDTVALEGKTYDRIRVTFDAEGGGRDHDDVYHYFFDRDSGELDYLAYTFEVDGGGIRFRKAINKRRVDGVLVQDYVNYGLDGADRDIDRIAARFAAGELPELSLIENTEVKIADPPAVIQ